jgi:hypothetical protein
LFEYYPVSWRVIERGGRGRREKERPPHSSSAVDKSKELLRVSRNRKELQSCKKKVFSSEGAKIRVRLGK